MTPAFPGRRLGATIAALAVGAVTLTSAVVAPQPAHAQEPGALTGSARPAGQPTTVTLITGDRVQVSLAADGTPSAVVESSTDFYTRRVGDDLYVIPVSAERALAEGRLDTELFNVTGLVRQGYDDASRTDLPLLVTGSLPQARGLSGVSTGVHLDSIGATAVTVAKDGLAAAFDGLTGGTARGTGTGKIWLDGKVEGFDLDPTTGVEQTGAPDLWNLGLNGEGTKVAVLDTGYDAAHPDLAGQVLAAEDFTGEGSPLDRDGHGTHVASTIAGTGAADASKVGMAPGTGLLIGRVLSYGGGQTSWIVAGMEWAVAQGADVVNMSLGSSEPTDCTDPMAQAAAELSAQSKTLFVIAAGNSGMRETVSSPGCVQGVLTVGAVDAEGATASFSSRGPVPGNHELKPDISAPGVAITGAAAGSLGEVHYTRMSGTSMATPHVAGAVALIRQAHPDWTAQQVKAALVGSVKRENRAKAPNSTVYEQGAGELWLPGALNATVTSDTGVRLADFAWPHGRDERATKKVTYTNTSDKPVTLTLEVDDLTGADGDRVPSRAITLESSRITIPANGTATVPVTANGYLHGLDASSYGEIGARIVATGENGVRVTTAVGFWLEPETVDVTVKAVDRTGAPATSGYLDITDTHQPARSLIYFTGEDITLRLRADSHVLSGFIRTAEPDGTFSYSYVGDPEARLTADTTITLDARKAKAVTVTGDRPLTIRSGSLHVGRSFDGWIVDNSVFAANGPAFYAAPTDRVRDGEFDFGTYLRAADPSVAEKDSTYVYNLAFTGDRVSRDQSHRVRDRDLATVTENYHTQRTPGVAYEWTRVLQDNGANPIYAGSGNPVTVPLTRTAYYTPGPTWQQIATTQRIRGETWFGTAQAYGKRQQGEVDWFKLPAHNSLGRNSDGTPTRVAERQGTLVGFAFAALKDGAGHVAAGGFGDIGNLRIYKNGELVGDSAWPSGQALVGSDDCVLRVEVTQFGFDKANWELAKGTLTNFEFASSRPEGDTLQALPVAIPSYDAPVDAYNLAPNTDTAFPVTVGLDGQDGYDPGAITSLTAKVTFEPVEIFGAKPVKDYAWTEVPVVQRDGRWVALVDNTAHAGGIASLWVNTVDANGSKTEQITVNLYGVA
ncbi:S8 family serine peptidase [Phytomonospora sp. NPDC050363]|uniref:S8 family serine peptidase n=1 Tax=Phytomonospora sp. NPDC050363 TaxID=3155642 RepID=UPI0033DE1313